MADSNPDHLRRWEAMIANILTMRQEIFRQFSDPRRNIEDECGYPRSDPGSINPEFYRQLYERESIATRVVEVLPKESWQVTPSVYESEESDEVTPFEEAWDALGESLHGEQSYYQDEQGSPIWEHLKRADILSGIGHFGVILLGIDDQKPYSEPAEGVGPKTPTGNAYPSKPSAANNQVPVYGRDAATGNPIVVNYKKAEDSQPAGSDAQYMGVELGRTQGSATKPSGKARRLLFLRCFDESLVQIVQYEADPRNPRFGQPVMYRITLNDPRDQHSGVGLTMVTVQVHWSRVIHLADNLGSSEVSGVPRMRPVLNRLLDLRKLYSGSAEMYWRGAFPGISFETHPQLGGDVLVDKTGLRDDYEQYQNGLQRALFLMGMSAKTLAPQVVDPSAQIEVQLEAICIQLACPVRVFKGSERGELASSQDDASWNDRLRERQGGYISPRIIVPFVDRLIALGVLPAPARTKPTANRRYVRISHVRTHVLNAEGELVKGPLKQRKTVVVETKAGYSIEWPDLDSLSDTDKAGIGLTRTQALAAYVAGNCETVVPPQAYLTGFLGMEDEEATSILEEAAKQHEADLEEQQQLADEHGFEPTPPPGFQAPAPEVPPGTPPGKGGPPKPQPKAAGAGGKPPKPPAVANALEDEEPTENFDPDQPRDEAGKFTSTGGGGKTEDGKGRLGKVMDGLKAAGAKVSHLEHVATAYASDKVEQAVGKLSPRGQTAARASFAVLRAGKAALFATWTATQALAERVAVERGRTEEEARSLRGTLATADLLTFKPASIGLGLTGIGAAVIGAASLLPPATAGYLAYSTAKNPLATYRAAKGLIKDAVAKVIPKQVLRDNMATNASYGQVQALDDALKAHGYSDWYVALLHAAMDETQDVSRAIQVADAAYKQSPVDSSLPQDDDEEVVLGPARHDTEAS